MTAILAVGVLLVVVLVTGAYWAYYQHARALLADRQRLREAEARAARAAASWALDPVPTATGDRLEIRLQRFARLPWGVEREGPALLVGVLDQHDPDYEIELARLTRAAHQRAAGLNMLRDDATGELG